MDDSENLQILGTTLNGVSAGEFVMIDDEGVSFTGLSATTSSITMEDLNKKLDSILRCLKNSGLCKKCKVRFQCITETKHKVGDDSGPN